MRRFLLFAVLLAAACQKSRLPPPVPATVVGDWRIGLRGFDDGLAVFPDGGFLHCWDVDGGQQQESGAWRIEGNQRATYLELRSFSDVRGEVPATRVHRILVTEGRLGARLEVSPDYADNFYRLDAGVPACP